MWWCVTAGGQNNLACASILLFQLLLFSVIQGENILICSAKHANIVQKNKKEKYSLGEGYDARLKIFAPLYKDISEKGFY